MKTYFSVVRFLLMVLLYAGLAGCVGTDNEGTNQRQAQSIEESEGEIESAELLYSDRTLSNRLIMIAIDGLHPDYLELDSEGFRGGSEGNWLMPNVRTFLETSTWFRNANCHLISATDMNHLNALSGTSSAQTGLIGISGQMIGWDDDGEAIVEQTDIEYLRDDEGRRLFTLFDAVKRQYPSATTAMVSGKPWVAEMYRSRGVVDHIVTGKTHSEYEYLRRPRFHNFFDPPTDQDPRCDSESTNQKALGSFFSLFPERFPSDEWIVNSTLSLFDHEDPAMSYILLAEMDDTGHAFGAAWDPDEFVPQKRGIRRPGCPLEYRTVSVSIRDSNVYREPILDAVRDVDYQFGRLMQGLEERGILEQATVVLLSDHSMVTHVQDRIVFPEHTDFEQLLRVANLIERDDFFAYGGSSVSLLYWREDPERAVFAKELLEAYHVVNPQTGEWETPWWVLDRDDMREGVPGVALPGELYHEYFVEVDQGENMVWPDLVLLARNGWQLPAYEGLYNLGIDLDIPLPPAIPFLGGHGSIDTRPIMMAFSLPESRVGAVRMDEVFISDISTTIAELFELELLSSTIGRDLSERIER